MNINEVEREIARLLCQFEKDSGSLVEGLELVKLETTRFDSPRQEFSVGVRVWTQRQAGHQWDIPKEWGSTPKAPQ